MKKRDYFMAAMRANLYQELEWCISAFSVVFNRPNLADAKYHLQLIYDPADVDAIFVAVRTENGMTAVKIEDSNAKLPLFSAKESVDLVEGDIPLIGGEGNTSYGIILGNMYILHYPFGAKFKYVNDVIDDSFDSSLSKLLVDYPAAGVPRDPTKIYVDEYLRYGKACGGIAGMDKLFSTGGSDKTLSVDPSVIALRDSLMEKYKGQLDDPRIQAEIEQAVVAADKASFKGDDDALDFLISKKSFNPTRKKQLVLIGGSAGFGGDNTYTKTSLLDGWKIEDLPMHANEARAGSFFRGKETAAGGSDVKDGTRMSMNLSIAPDFCGATQGYPVVISESDTKKFIGLYLVGREEPIHLTSENINQYVNKNVMIHSPMFCQKLGDVYCKYCIGDNWNMLENGLSTAITNIGDVYMNDKMKRMHGKALLPGTIKFLTHIK